MIDILIACFFLIVPGLYTFEILRTYIPIRSMTLRLAATWVISQYVSAWIIFLLCLVFTHFTSDVLFKAVSVYIILLTSAFIFFTDHIHAALLRFKYKNTMDMLFIVGMICVYFICAYTIFTNLLQIKNSIIFFNHGYWDFYVHFPIIQNFAYGDNFPPQNDSFAGIPMTYHFFFDFLGAIYASTGLGLVHGLNTVSILTFIFFMLAIIGIAEELLRSRLTGVVATVFILTSSSLRFIWDLSNIYKEGFLTTISSLVHTSLTPFKFSFLPDNPYGYNGTMFNIFYFIQERQIMFAITFLIIIIALFYHKASIHHFTFLAMGIFSGLFFQWHLFITILVGSSAMYLLLFTRNRKNMLYFLIGFSIICTIYTIYFTSITRTEWFYTDIAEYPKINFNFPTMGTEYPLSVSHVFLYYIFGYGIKLPLFFSGMYVLYRKYKPESSIFLSVIIPAFVLTNTIQLSPISVYDNHKWFVPLNVFISIIAAFYCLYSISRYLKHLPIKIFTGILLFFLCTLSGTIELIPFITARPIYAFADLTSPFLTFVSSTPKDSVFASNTPKEIQVAGRKLFYAKVNGQDLRLNTQSREVVMKDLYTPTDKKTLCSLTNQHNISYLVFDETTPLTDEIKDSFSTIQKHTSTGEQFILINMKANCKNTW